MKFRVMITTTKADCNPPQLILYRNYSFFTTVNSHDTLSNQVIDPKKALIWKVARSSRFKLNYKKTKLKLIALL